ncbi:hypothetical protein U1Q18_019314 [Sarracenia purpurea var. burkii]
MQREMTYRFKDLESILNLRKMKNGRDGTRKKSNGFWNHEVPYLFDFILGSVKVQRATWIPLRFVDAVDKRSSMAAF